MTDGGDRLLDLKPADKRFLKAGFVPCVSCREKSYESLLDEIHKKRLTPTPFNESEYEVAIYSILDSSHFSVKDKYFIVRHFLYNIKHRKTNERQNKNIKNIFKLIDQMLRV